MKIALTIEHFDPSRGGGEIYCRNFARRLLRDGHEVHIFAFSWDPAETGFAFHRLRMPPGKLFRRYFFAQRAAEAVAGQPFDIVQGLGKSIHMDVYRPGGGVHRAWMEHHRRASDGAIPRIALALRQGLSIDQRLVLHLERRQFGPGGRHQIIAVSKFVRDEMIRFYHTEPERIHLIYNGVDTERFTPRLRAIHRAPLRRELGFAERDVMLLFVGHNYKRKGLHALVRALPGLRRFGVRCRVVVVGKGRRAPVDRLAERLGVADQIQYVGAASDPERFHAAADIFCFPSYYDPFGNTVLEALSSGLPAVTSTTTGVGEMITPGREGYAVDADDADRMAQCIGEFLDPERRAEAAQAARALAERHTFEAHYQAVLRLYDIVRAARA